MSFDSQLARREKGIYFVYRNMTNYYYNSSQENSFVNAINAQCKNNFLLTVTRVL